MHAKSCEQLVDLANLSRVAACQNDVFHESPLLKALATEAHGITRKKKALKELFPFFPCAPVANWMFLLMAPHKPGAIGLHTISVQVRPAGWLSAH
jgi:hypothetical protein